MISHSKRVFLMMVFMDSRVTAPHRMNESEKKRQTEPLEQVNTIGPKPSRGLHMVSTYSYI